MKRLRNFVDHHPLSAFLLLAFGIAWILWIPGVLVSHGRTVSFGIFGIYSPALAGMIVSHRGKRIDEAWKVRLVVFAAALLIAVVSMLSASYFVQHIPLSSQTLIFAVLASSIVAWIVSGAHSRDAGTREYLWTLVHPKKWAWLLIAIGSFALYLLIPAAIYHIVGRSIFPPNFSNRQNYLALFPASFSYTFFFGGGVSEEPGWRGFLLVRLQTKYSPLLSSFCVWVPWALWHLPLDYTSSLWASPRAYFNNRVLLLLPLTILMTWLYNRSGKAILTTALFHATFNTLPDFLPSAPGMTWLLWAWALAVIVTDRMWISDFKTRAAKSTA